LKSQREIEQGARRDLLYSVPAPGTSHGRCGGSSDVIARLS
jgi:hypothetical protein